MTKHPLKSPGYYLINKPTDELTLEQRAFQMWAVHPNDLIELGLTREQFYLAHLQAVLEQAQSSK